ncbi:putative death-receptor fusion protein-domain-containing protein [Staphylotrichum tortipilum]|uniref:Death-receptor fusion protein-domain-containing protein n=1 Tax=Staphylotrichum tortipilum TaxID=2831512 RepID=A0AAN6MJM7_9PEZI|nr:putative death-receptor fusion protein-domain-containing protein [Staphylotrichum longicolle]
MAQDSPVETKPALAGLDPGVFENANTISKWLQSQPQDTQSQLAQDLFDKLFREATQSRQYHGNGHACVKVCSFVQQCAKSANESVKAWAFTEALSLKLFHFYLEWYEHDPHRALRLVLDVLVVSSTFNPSPETGRSIRDHILDTLVSIITRKSAQQLIKSGLQCLEHFLSKRVIDLNGISRKYKEAEPTTAAQDTTASDSESFTLEVWRQWLQDALAQKPETLEDLKNYVLASIFKTDRESSLRLLGMFNQSQPLTAVSHDLADQQLLLQLAALELGKKHGLVEEPSNDDGVAQPPTAKAVVLQGSLLDRLLAHPSASVRSSAFSLLVSSQATTKPFSSIVFSLLKKHLAAFHADYDARVRNEVLGHTKNLIRRAKNIITVSQRSLAAYQAIADGSRPPVQKKFGPEVRLKDAAEARDILERHEAFLGWYRDFLKSELVPTASYQRHITALRAALLLIRVGKHAGATDDIVDEDIAQLIVSDSTWVRLLLDLLLDPFDDVRDSSATLLGILPPKPSGADVANSTDLLKVLRVFCTRASKLADRTGREDHGDGAARSQALLCTWLGNQDLQLELLSEIIDRVESKISKAEEDLGYAAIENPVHADFAAISYVWQVLAKETFPENQIDVLHHLQRRVLFSARQIWLTVKHVLCDDSPEGHLPEELEDIEGLDTKGLLSYSFRAVHESSNLLRLLVGTLRVKKAPGVPYPPLDVFRETGYLAFEQLASLRHRGAFSTVAYTFTNCCQLTQLLKDVYTDLDESENLLREWYQGAINCIMTQASTTRRSAGIPSLIAAVLTANATSPSFDEVYRALETIGKKTVRMSETDGSNLPQVHALNSLRDIFRSSVLSRRAEGYLGRTLHLAATSLKSEVWAIRNCGLLLLRSLIDALLGTGESKAAIESGWDGHSIRISYNKYPALPGVILGLLRSVDETLDQASQSGAAEAVFPALDIIRRAGPPEENRSELRKHIEGYLGSRLWHVREIAARTLCSFLLQEGWAKEIERLFAESGGHTNRLHGTLLTARFVLERNADLGVDLTSDPASIELLLGQLAQRQRLFRRCAELQAASLEILNLLSSLGCHEQVVLCVPCGDRPVATAIPSALLDLQAGLKLVYDIAASGDSTIDLFKYLQKMLRTDVNTACRVLEAIPAAWKQVGRADLSGLCELYLDLCALPSPPEVRSQVLRNLGPAMEELLGQGESAKLPAAERLDELWKTLQQGEINPTLSCAIIETSGTIMAALVSRGSDNVQNLEQRLRGWGDMLFDCLDVDNPFDTRYAAATAMKSFFAHAHPLTWDTAYLPVFSALYESLVDDDDEVRETTAGAASSLLGTPLIAPTAADRLVPWLRERFGDAEEFRARVACRMVGQLYTAQVALVPAAEQLRRSMAVDDSLFAAEDQNLFVDEVRETARWARGALAGVLPDNPQAQGGSAAISSLKTWVADALTCLVALARRREDGPLGWAADQHVFAVCARVVLCAVAASRGEDGEGVVRGLLGEFVGVGERGRVHGSLLELAREGLEEGAEN